MNAKIIFQIRPINCMRQHIRFCRRPVYYLFSVSPAIDVLTTGTYPDLPRSIKDRYVPPEPISKTEKAETLKRLNQVIKCRLVSSDLPSRINDFNIDNGILSFTVNGEFAVDLTLCGEGKDIPWSLLRLKFLVKGWSIRYCQFFHLFFFQI